MPLLLNFYAIKNKALTLLLAFTFLSVTSFSQTIKENIEKQIKDHKTSENADSIAMQKLISLYYQERKIKKETLQGKTVMLPKEMSG